MSVNDYEVNVGVVVDDSKLNALETKIKNLKDGLKDSISVKLGGTIDKKDIKISDSIKANPIEIKLSGKLSRKDIDISAIKQNPINIKLEGKLARSDIDMSSINKNPINIRLEGKLSRKDIDISSINNNPINVKLEGKLARKDIDVSALKDKPIKIKASADIVDIDMSDASLKNKTFKLKANNVDIAPVKFGIDTDGSVAKKKSIKLKVDSANITPEKIGVDATGAVVKNKSIKVTGGTVNLVPNEIKLSGVSIIDNDQIIKATGGHAVVKTNETTIDTNGNIADVNGKLNGKAEHADVDVDNAEVSINKISFNEAELNKSVNEAEEKLKSKFNKITDVVKTTTKGKNYITVEVAVNGIDKLGNAVKQTETIMQYFKKTSKNGTSKLITETVRDVDKLSDRIGKAKKIIDEFSTGDIKFDKLSAGYEKISNKSIELEKAYKECLAAQSALSTEINKGEDNVNGIIAANERRISTLRELEKQINNNKSAEKKYEQSIKLDIAKQKLYDNTELYLKNNTAISKEYRKELQALQKDIMDCANAFELMQKKANIDSLQRKIKLEGQGGLTFFDSIKTKTKEYAKYALSSFGIMEIVQALQHMYDAVLEVDAAMTGLRRVTDLTGAQYDVLYDNMIASAKEYGATLTDIINATSDWVRAGFDSETALGLAEVTTVYQHISDLDYDTAAENLLTAYNGFKDQLLALTDGDIVRAVSYVSDIFNELDKINCP